MVIEVQRTFEGQKRAQIGPEGGLKDAGFMESRVLFRKQPRLYILKVVYSQSLTAIGDGLWSLGDLVVVVHKSWSAEPFFSV